MSTATPRLVLGKYPSVDALYGAARALQAAGHSALDFYSPYPLPGSDEVLRLKKSPVPFIAGTAACIGVVSGVLMQWWMNDVDYPINVANRSVVPTPTWMPVTFELGVLLDLFVAIFVMGIIIHKISREFSTLSTRMLSELKE